MQIDDAMTNNQTNEEEQSVQEKEDRNEEEDVRQTKIFFYCLLILKLYEHWTRVIYILYVFSGQAQLF